MVSGLAPAFVDSLDLEVFSGNLGRDVEAALRAGLEGGVVFPEGNEPLSIFRGAVMRAVRDIESHERGKLLQRLLRDGSCGADEAYSPEVAGSRLSDAEIAAAVNFICFQVVNSFQGSTAEMLAAAPCLGLVRQLQRAGRLSAEARLFAGDTVTARQFATPRRDRAADLHVLVEAANRSGLAVAGVVEVKSSYCSPGRLERQLERHLSRAKLGLTVKGKEYLPQCIKVGEGRKPAIKIMVVPSTWKLPRTIAFRPGSRTLDIPEPDPPAKADAVTQIDEKTWRITLRWSYEALAADAYDMTFWYMSKVGEVIYANGSPWSEMTPAQAGLNAVKWAMHLAPLRALTTAQEQRAVALANIYGYGYSLGNSYRSEENGERDTLFPEDLDEILRTGRTRNGFRMV